MKDNTILIIAAVASILLGLFDLSLVTFWNVSPSKVSMGFVLLPLGIVMLCFALSTRKFHKK